MSKTRIPLRNIYYLLAYAWEFVGRGEEEFLTDDEFDNSNELLGRVFDIALTVLIRKGLCKAYITRAENIRGLRGKLLLSGTLKSATLFSGQTICDVDEQSFDCPLNQVVKSALRILEEESSLSAELKRILRQRLDLLSGISDIEASSKIVRSLHTNSHTRHYQFILYLCRLIFDSAGPNREKDGNRLQGFLEQESLMHDVFETFVRRFLEKHLAAPSVVTRENYKWEVGSGDDLFTSRVPGLSTDISIVGPNEVFVIDTKYYAEALVRRYGNFKFRRDHLSQLMDYLRAAQRRHGKPVRGMLLYPAVDNRFRSQGMLEGFDITVATIDLNVEWSQIRQSLLELSAHRAPGSQPAA